MKDPKTETMSTLRHFQLREKLIENVIEQIKTDIEEHDITAIDKLLTFTPIARLIEYLPKNEHSNYELIKTLAIK